MPTTGNFVPGQVLTASELNTEFGDKQDAGLPIVQTGGVIGSGDYFWTNLGPARINYLQDRVFVGAAASVNAGNVPESPADWTNLLLPTGTQNSQFVVINTIGTIGIFGASRSSDFGAAQQGTIAVYGAAFNDYTAGASSAWGGFSQATRNSGAGNAAGSSTLAHEFDVDNLGSVVDIVPAGAGFFPAGLTANLWVSAGTSRNSSAAQVSCAIGILSNPYPGNTTSKFRKGIVFQDVALDATVGNGGKGVAVEMLAGQELRWLNSSNVVISEIWAGTTSNGTTGLELNAGNIVATGNLYCANQFAITVFIPLVNFNSANTDYAVAITLPPGFTNYRLQGVQIVNPSVAINGTATFNIYTAAAAGGVAMYTSNVTMGITSVAANTNGNMQNSSPTNATTLALNALILYFHTVIAFGSAATATVAITYIPLY
jgi:hypothetical protein